MAEMIMKQKALSLKESYELYSGVELKYVIQRRKLFTSKPAYDIFIEEGVVATAEVTNNSAPKIYSLSFRNEPAGEVRYDEIPGTHKLVYEEKGIEVTGNSMLTEFTVLDRQKNTIGSIKKKIVSMKDTYDISFINNSDELLFAMLALLVDETFHG